MINSVIIVLLVLTLTGLCFTRLSVVVLLLLIAEVVQANFDETFYLAVGAFHVYVADIFFISFVLSFFARALRSSSELSRRLSTDMKLIAVYSVIVSINLAIGWFAFHTTAVVASRPVIYYLGIILAFGSSNMASEEAEKLLKYISAISVVYLILTYFRWFGLIAKPVYLASLEGSWLADRVLNRSQAIFLFFGLVYVLARSVISGSRLNLSSAFYLVCNVIALLILQIRSIWALSLLGAFLIYSRGMSVFRRRVRFAMLGLSVVVVALAGAEYVGKIQNIKDAFLEATTYQSESTFYWRNVVNAAYLTSMRFENFLRGSTFGNEPFTDVGSQVGSYGLHNNYLEVLYYGGVLGFLTFYVAYARLLRQLNRLAKADVNWRARYAAQILEIVLLSNLVFFFSWTIDTLTAIAIGAAMVVARQVDQLGPSDKKILTASKLEHIG